MLFPEIPFTGSQSYPRSIGRVGAVIEGLDVIEDGGAGLGAGDAADRVDQRRARWQSHGISAGHAAECAAERWQMPARIASVDAEARLQRPE
jgi:hypothetical protein